MSASRFRWKQQGEFVMALPRPKLSELEELLLLQLRNASALRARPLPPWQREYQFEKARKWRFDFAWPQQMVAIECEGGTWSGGAHTRGKHFESDCEKYNLAAMLGWAVGRFTLAMIKRGDAIEWLVKALGRNGKEFTLGGPLREFGCSNGTASGRPCIITPQQAKKVKEFTP